MASAAEVGALRVTLGMDMAQFSEGAKKAEQVLSSLAAKIAVFSGIGAGLGAMIGGRLADAFGSYVTSIKDAIHETDEIESAAKKFGLTISEVTGLIRDNGLDVSTFKDGMDALGESIFKVASGDATSEAARAFTAIGVSALDAAGKMRPVGDVLKDIAGKFSTYKDGIARTTLATDLFAKSGKDMVDVLGRGAKAFKESADGGLDLSHVMVDLYNNASTKFKDAWDELATSTSNFLNAVTGGLPTAKEFAVTLRDWGQAALDSLPSTKQIKEAIDALFEAALKTEQRFERLGANIAGAGRAIMALFTSDDVKKVNDETEAAIKKIDASGAASLATFRAVAAGWGATVEEVKKASKSVTITDAPMKQSLKEIADAQKAWNRSVQDGVTLAKQAEGPWEKYARQTADLGNAFKVGKIGVEAFALAQKKALEDANIAFAGGADLIAKSLSPYEQLQQELEKLREKYDAGAISARALGQAQQAAVLIAATAYAGFASDVGHSLVTVFNKNKGIAIAVGTIDAIGAGLKALSAYPPPFSYVAAAAALAAGMAQVARIQSTSSGGGGGGGGSVGSAAAGTGGGTGSSPQLLTVQGINESDRYSGGQMRDLANALIKYQKDGGQVLIK